MLEQLSALLVEATPEDRKILKSIQETLKEIEQVNGGIETVQREINDAKAMISKWDNAFDSDSATQGVYWGERKLEEARNGLNNLQGKLTRLNADRERLKNELNASISNSTNQQYIVGVKNILKNL